MDPAEGPATARVTPEHRYENTAGPIGRVNPPVRDGSYEGLYSRGGQHHSRPILCFAE
jgi:hypothetical protein